MANRQKGEVQIHLAGEDLTLLFDYNAICQIEESFDGKSIDVLLFSGQISRTVIRQAIYHGIQRNYGSQKKITVEMVGEMIAETFAARPDSMKDLIIAVIGGVLAGNGAADDEVTEVIAMTEAQLSGTRHGKGGRPLAVQPGENRSEATGTG